MYAVGGMLLSPLYWWVNWGSEPRWFSQVRPSAKQWSWNLNPNLSEANIGAFYHLIVLIIWSVFSVKLYHRGPKGELQVSFTRQSVCLLSHYSRDTEVTLWKAGESWHMQNRASHGRWAADTTERAILLMCVDSPGCQHYQKIMSQALRSICFIPEPIVCNCCQELLQGTEPPQQDHGFKAQQLGTWAMPSVGARETRSSQTVTPAPFGNGTCSLGLNCHRFSPTIPFRPKVAYGTLWINSVDVLWSSHGLPLPRHPSSGVSSLQSRTFSHELYWSPEAWSTVCWRAGSQGAPTPDAWAHQQLCQRRARQGRFLKMKWKHEKEGGISTSWHYTQISLGCAVQLACRGCRVVWAHTDRPALGPHRRRWFFWIQPW